MKYRSCHVVFALLGTLFALVHASVAAEYTLDLLSPARIFDTNFGVSAIPLPSRVCIVVKPARLGFDKTWAEVLMEVKQPAFSSTNTVEISALMERLRKEDNRHRIENISHVSGVTYHCLMFRESDKTVMHFRVFKPALSNGVASAIWPRSDTGFIYYNAGLFPWIQERIGKQ